MCNDCVLSRIPVGGRCATHSALIQRGSIGAWLASNYWPSPSQPIGWAGNRACSEIGPSLWNHHGLRGSPSPFISPARTIGPSLPIVPLRDHKPRKWRTICAERVNAVRETRNRFALLGTGSRNKARRQQDLENLSGNRRSGSYHGFRFRHSDASRCTCLTDAAQIRPRSLDSPGNTQLFGLAHPRSMDFSPLLGRPCVLAPSSRQGPALAAD